MDRKQTIYTKGCTCTNKKIEVDESKMYGVPSDHKVPINLLQKIEQSKRYTNMETKTKKVEIEIPDGYEIETQVSYLKETNNIVFPEAKNMPESIVVFIKKEEPKKDFNYYIEKYTDELCLDTTFNINNIQYYKGCFYNKLYDKIPITNRLGLLLFICKKKRYDFSSFFKEDSLKIYKQHCLNCSVEQIIPDEFLVSIYKKIESLNEV